MGSGVLSKGQQGYRCSSRDAENVKEILLHLWHSHTRRYIHTHKREECELLTELCQFVILTSVTLPGVLSLSDVLAGPGQGQKVLLK